MPDTPHPERRRKHVYGRRKGPRLSAHQESALKTQLPPLSPELEKGRDPRRYFTAPINEVWLEVGFGAGEHLLWQAQNNPAVGLIGAEPFVNGVAKLLTKLPEPAPNIRIYMGDARDIVEALPDASLSRFFILFPDPWPKTRHHKRRFLQTEMLDQLARVLKPGAELRFASDDKTYVAYALERLMAHPQFGWTAERAADWQARPADWPPTRYEIKAIRGVPVFLRFRRL